MVDASPIGAIVEWTKTWQQMAATTVETFFGNAEYDALLEMAPEGDGHTVMLTPGFCGTNHSMSKIYKLGEALGYDMHYWDERWGGINLGPSPQILGTPTQVFQQTEERLHDLFNRQNDKVTIIGHSLGGCFAAVLARLYPNLVRSYMTLGSPILINDRPDAVSDAANIPFRWLNGDRFEAYMQMMAEPSNVPAVHIYDPDDWVVDTCISKDQNNGECIKVNAGHMGMPHNIETLRAIADRLPQPGVKHARTVYDRETYVSGAASGLKAPEVA